MLKSKAEKRCSKCGEIKSISEFYKEKRSRDGYRSDCKDCKGVTKKRYRNSKKGKVILKQYRNSKKGKEAEWRYRNSEKRKKSKKRYENSEKGKQCMKKRNATRRTDETHAGGSYTYPQWYNLCKFYDFYCLKCSKKYPFEKLTFDHIKPVSKGGSSFIFNAQPLCDRCNKSKGGKEIDYRKTLPDWISRDRSIWAQDRLL